MVRRGRQESRRTGPRTAVPVARSVLLAAWMVLLPDSALALDPSLDVSQYAHTAWRIRDGFLSSRIYAIAQTPDGYLWLGTEFGLLRFDGVRTVPWNPAWGQLPSSYVRSLLVARDGTLWIGTPKGLASWKDGKLKQISEVAGRNINGMTQDREGTIWFGTGYGDAPLCRIAAGNIACEGTGTLAPVVDVHEDRSGNLWVIAGVGGATHLWRWRPRAREEYQSPFSVSAVGEDDRGAILLAASDGVKELSDGKIVSHPVEGLTSMSRPVRFLRSSDGSLWIGTFNGLVHAHGGRSDVFTVAHGLSGEIVYSIYEDREGSVWVSTSGGLDRFRDYTFPRITADQGLSSSTVWGVVATPDGGVWIAASDGLNRWGAGRATFLGRRAERTSAPRTGISSSAVLDARAQSLGVDDKGRLWAGTRDGMFVLETDGFARVAGLPGTNTYPMAPDGRGGMWIPASEGLFHWRDGTVSHFPWTQFGGNANARAILPERAKDGLWLGFDYAGLSYIEDGRVLAAYAPANGLGSGRVAHLRRDDRGAVWASTEGGLSRIDDGQIATLTSKNGLPCDAVNWSIEDDHGSVWVYMRCGLVRIARADLDAWASDTNRRVEITLFDAADGAIAIGAPYSYGPSVTKTPDGRIWFTGPEGVTIIDPPNLRRNEQPPPVRIEQILADGKIYDQPGFGNGPLPLPSRVRDLEIDYTALSLRAPEKVRFRVKLEGQDKDWRELLNERHVTYTNLAPRSYRFLVKAANDSGVWNEEGAALAFTIPPAFYQTVWFRTLCLAALAGLLWGAYRVRIGALERSRRILERHEAEITALNERLMKAQEEERSRIAGELHDGILQELTTASLNLGTIKYQVPPESVTRTEIAGVQQHLIELGQGVRQLSHELHPSVLQESGLPVALASYCEEFSKTRGIPVSCEADSSVTELSRGTSLALYRIAQEALGNAAKHANPRHIEVRVVRIDGLVRLSVSDDGSGFLVERPSGSGGLGLVNMRERMRALGGRLEVESQPGRGTAVLAEVPFRSG